MRRHVPHPVEEDPVRTYVTFRYSGVACLRRRQPENYSILGPRATSEVRDRLKDSTNDVAHCCAHCFDQQINAKIQPSFAKDLNIRHSQTSDANLSKRGSFKAYSLSPNNGYDSDSKQSLLEAKTLHVYKLDASLESFSGSLGIVGNLVLLFMGHKCEDNSAKALFAAFVAVCKNIGNIGAEATMTGVLEQLNYSFE
ncbi:hypothetical protein PC128_g3880 [Phytophthora cactorum]|nr:hypothetical protein PC120_g6576 [Phytophthora cactorum]KAG3091936.1 hypothetical protein PC121_g3723 [Phytophthora cactorum]KAG3201424.1 hypothetical protein PC128_g3880 [Phytophthora cactorum]KAG4062431.1 hypothetical protein PC123_g2698 [Phytophthora cactorum]